mgnify:FL=1|jgi:uncharacterized Zn-binding protein involved in type VI secretion|tara:strand:- start:97 stop:498 length:402 start_codon:yes stop_codon:yes gene_type:complete
MAFNYTPGTACRIGDIDLVHCSTPHRMQGSPNVFAESLPWSCQGHLNTPHLLPCILGCCGHLAPIAKGSTTVFVNGLGAGRIGDGIAGCTKVFASDNKTVFAGAGGGAVTGSQVDPQQIIDDRIQAVFEGTAV